MIVKLTVQGNIWIGNKSRLIMITIYGNRYRSMVCLYMVFLKETRESVNTQRNRRQEQKSLNRHVVAHTTKIHVHALLLNLCLYGGLYALK
jgi:hypothetical protein